MAFAGQLWRALKAVGRAVGDAVPPYRRIEGRLVAKEPGPEGKHYILVDSEVVEVDWLTFETLEVGEPLRIRCTRDNKAINIDRLVP